MLAAVTTLRDDPGALLQRGVKLADAGDVDAAIAAHEAALAIDPSLAQAHANLIALYGRQRNCAKAEEHYRAVVALGVNVADAHYDYGVLLGLQERVGRRGRRLPPRARAESAARARRTTTSARCSSAAGKFEAAADEYRAARCESQPTLRLARFNLGRMLIALGRPDEAVAELQKLTEPRDAEAPRYLFALSTAHVRAGRQERRNQVGDRRRETSR